MSLEFLAQEPGSDSFPITHFPVRLLGGVVRRHETNRMVKARRQKHFGVVLFVGLHSACWQMVIRYLPTIRGIKISDYEEAAVMQQPVNLCHCPEQIKAIDPVKDKVDNNEIEHLLDWNGARCPTDECHEWKPRFAVLDGLL